MTERRTRTACWLPKATNTRSEYVIFIACPLQQQLHKRASTLRYTYIACLVKSKISARGGKSDYSPRTPEQRTALLLVCDTNTVLEPCSLKLVTTTYKVKTQLGKI